MPRPIPRWTRPKRTRPRPRLINGEAPAAMARAAADKGVPFLHISTDYVFDGSGTTPWAPDAPTGPLGAYGRSKLAGEEGVRAAGGAHAILRTSWVFSAHGSNFVQHHAAAGRDPRQAQRRGRSDRRADGGGGYRRCAAGHGAGICARRRTERHLSFLRRARHQLDRFRARDLCPCPAAGDRYRYSDHGLPHSGAAVR